MCGGSASVWRPRCLRVSRRTSSRAASRSSCVEHWARIIVNVRSAGESNAAFQYTNEIRDIVQKYYPDTNAYVVGVTPATQDIRDIITADYGAVNVISLLGVALVVALTYKSLLLPLVVLIPIESAVFINTALPYIYGQRTMFLGFIIVSCVQLGATIDYSILMTGNYLDARAAAAKKKPPFTPSAERTVHPDLGFDSRGCRIRSVLPDLGGRHRQPWTPDWARRTAQHVPRAVHAARLPDGI